jgi:hypothetical protein
VAKLDARTLEYGIDLLVKSRGEVKHPNPRAAIGLAVMMTVGAMWELVVTPPDPKVWKGLIPTDDQTLQRELTRSFLSYLGVERKKNRRELMRIGQNAPKSPLTLRATGV